MNNILIRPVVCNDQTTLRTGHPFQLIVVKMLVMCFSHTQLKTASTRLKFHGNFEYGSLTVHYNEMFHYLFSHKSKPPFSNKKRLSFSVDVITVKRCFTERFGLHADISIYRFATCTNGLPLLRTSLFSL